MIRAVVGPVARVLRDVVAMTAMGALAHLAADAVVGALRTAA